jgi:NTE family protein
MERMAQWTMRDVPRLIAEGRRAATAALEQAASHDRFARPETA